MTAEEYADYKRELESIKNYKQVWLSKSEYANVMSELNTNMSAEDRKHAIVSKAIGDYIYTVINNGFDDYTVIAKRKIQ